MKNTRRRVFYVDRVFQKKLLFLFLGINGITIIAYIVFYLSYLKGAVEENLFRSHITISNIKEVIARDIIMFNIALAVVIVFLVLLFYSITRLKLRVFLNQLNALLAECRSKGKVDMSRFRFSEEFQGIDRILEDFIRYRCLESEREQNRIAEIIRTISIK